MKKTAPPDPTKPNVKAKGTAKKKSPRVDVFIARYLVHMNGRRAAVEAGYSEHTARDIACELLAKPEVAEQVQRAIDARIKRTEITQDKVLERFWDLATADPNDLIEMRRVCCRYCHGKGHKYQRTPLELREALAQFQRDKLEFEATGRNFTVAFDAQGGVGYNPHRDPHPDCPECFGQGVAEPFVKDSRDLSPQAKRLYAGVEKTKDGTLKIKMRDQDSALLNVAKHLGMFPSKVVHGNDPENPLPPVTLFKLADLE